MSIERTKNSKRISKLSSPRPVVMLCCCFRFRIPRTKQDIEADHQRRKIAKKFREKLMKIKNTEMENMDLPRALERIQSEILLDQYDGPGDKEDAKLLEVTKAVVIKNKRGGAFLV